MPTYHEIMTTDLSTLTTAADSWDEMAGEFHKQEKAYKRDVHGISIGQTWMGLSAEAANRRFDITLQELQNAQTEAKAVASLLRDAHVQFVDLRSKLRTARQEATDAGMRVSDKGVVSFDTERLSQGTRTAYHHDPDYQDSVRKAVRSWQDRIDQLVKDMDDADKGVEIAFNAVVIDSDTKDGTAAGFNGQAQGDIETYKDEFKKEQAERKAESERRNKEKESEDDTLKTIIRGISNGVQGLTKPGDLGTKFLNATIEGIAGATGYNKTQGITLGAGVGWGGGGIGYEISLAGTRTPDDRLQIGVLTSRSVSSSGMDLGFSGTVGTFKSNADDISQLEGKGWDKGASLKAGAGLYGSHQTAIGTDNSRGEGVNTVSYGLGLGLGAEIGGGYSDAKARWQTETGSDE